MIKTAKSIFLAMGVLVIISFLLPGCYTQFSRPRVDTEDEYYDDTEYDDVEEYYQDEGVPSSDDSRDVYIYTYYPYSWYDYDYSYYYPRRWRYVGPYPDYWWDPYGRWWTPGWYVGFSYYDYYWGGYHRYYDSHYRYGYYGGKSNRTFSRRTFDRRSIGIADRGRRNNPQNNLATPITPNRVERPSTTLATPSVRDKSLSPDRKSRTVKEMVDQRLRTRTKIPQVTDDGTSRTTTKDRPAARTARTVKNPPRSTNTTTKPRIIKRAPSKSTPAKTKKNYSTPKRSSNRNSKSVTRSSNSGNTRVSKPATKSYTPRSSSSSRSTTRSTPTRSSSGKSSSSSSKSSGSSRTKK
jgi:hypothetical protein